MGFTANRVQNFLLLSRSNIRLRRALQIALVVLLTITPVLLTIQTIHLYAVDIPLTDAWDLWIGPESPRGDTLLIESITSRWQLRNEGVHRQFTSQLLAFFYLKFAPLSMVPAYAFSVLLAVLALLTLIDAAWRVHKGRITYVTGIMFSMLIFTSVASVRWLNTNGVVIFQGVFLSVAAFWLLTHPNVSRRSYLLALLAAALSAMSIASGNVTLIVGGVGLLFTPYRRRGYVLLWALVSALLLGSYLWDRFLLSDDPLTLAVTQQRGIGAWLQFVLSSIGAPIAPPGKNAIIVSAVLGAVGLAAAITLLVALWRRGHFKRDRSAFWIFLLVWVFLNIAQIGLLRNNFDNSALRVRYMVNGSLFWTSLVALSAPLLEDKRCRSWRPAAAVGLGLLLGAHVIASAAALLSGNVQEFSADSRASLDCLQSYDFRSPCFHQIWRDVEPVQMAIPYLYQFHPPFVNASDEQPDYRYEFYLPAAPDLMYHTVAVNDQFRAALRARANEPLEWMYPVPPSSQLTFTMGLWIAPDENNSYKGAMFTISLTNDHPAHKAPVAMTYQYFVADGEAMRTVQIPVPRQTTTGSVTLRLSVHQLLDNAALDESRRLRTYWVSPRVTIQIVESPA